MQFLLPSLAVGYIADLIFGDPHRIRHPVRLIGSLITAFEKGLRIVLNRRKRRLPCPAERKSAGKNAAETAAGLILVLLVLFCVTAAASVLLLVCYRVHPAAGFAAQSYLCYTILATKSLKVESMKVYRVLREEGVEAGRRAVSMIVGRDTDALDTRGVIKAAVETVAENTSDGVIAPLFFLVIGGPVIGYFYKAVNTMDSMVGYKNEAYRHFGTTAARLDDALNFLPSRISAILMIGAVFLLSVWEKTAGAAVVRQSAGGARTSKVPYFMPWRTSARRNTGDVHTAVSAQWNVKNAARIWKRDRRCHASPNSAQTEAVMAGALGVQLAGDAWYFGEKHAKPTIGDDLRPTEAEDIPRANRLMYATGIFGVVVFVLLRLAAAVCLR
ncbi:MAG: adenosylcobinamide-phosphate synthase CbiB [Clostridiales bacterium]|nr:adenosylcobinamide-phosphate synthase CbiB [Clostridiales bacterium]